MKQLQINFYVVGASFSAHYYLNEFNQYGERQFKKDKPLITKREIKKLILEEHSNLKQRDIELFGERN